LFAYVPLILWLFRCRGFIGNKSGWLIFPLGGTWIREPAERVSRGGLFGEEVAYAVSGNREMDEA